MCSYDTDNPCFQLALNYEKAMFGVTDNNFQQVKEPTKIA